MIYMLISITVLTMLLFGFNRFKGKVIACPICAATVLTWSVGLVGMYLGLFQVDGMFLAILAATSLGASTEKYGSKFGLLWKVSMVILGGPAIYYLSQNSLLTAIYFLIALLFVTVILSLRFSSKPTRGAYKETFKDCCN